MSLEAKFAQLKIDDASSIVEAVKKDGVQKSGLADSISALAAKCASSDDDEALAAFATVKKLAEECPEAQAFTKECLTPCKYTLHDFPQLSNAFNVRAAFVVNKALCLGFFTYSVEMLSIVELPSLTRVESVTSGDRPLLESILQRHSHHVASVLPQLWNRLSPRTRPSKMLRKKPRLPFARE